MSPLGQDSRVRQSRPSRTRPRSVRPEPTTQLATPAGAAGPGELSPPPEKRWPPPRRHPRPTRPPLTGDAQKDISRNSLSYERQLDDWHAATIDAQNAKAQPIAAKQAADELRSSSRTSRSSATRSALASSCRSASSGQTQIDDAVKAKMTAQGDLGEAGSGAATGARGAESPPRWPSSAAASGRVFLAAGGMYTHGNLVLDQINKTTDREYEAAKDRLQQRERVGFGSPLRLQGHGRTTSARPSTTSTGSGLLGPSQAHRGAGGTTRSSSRGCPLEQRQANELPWRGRWRSRPSTRTTSTPGRSRRDGRTSWPTRTIDASEQVEDGRRQVQGRRQRGTGRLPGATDGRTGAPPPARALAGVSRRLPQRTKSTS